MHYRNAALADVPAIMEIIERAVDVMLCRGQRQWDHSYPGPTDILADIAAGNGRVLEDGGGIVVAYGAVVYSGEPAYDEIDGDWLSGCGNYAVVHRLAVDPSRQGCGAGKRFLDITADVAAAEGIGSFRIDTNHDNAPMLRLLEKCGFAHCGTIRYPKGERMAFEKLI